jgi:hypothetical protein
MIRRRYPKGFTSKMRSSPYMAPLLKVFPEINTTSATIIIYGTKGDPSYSFRFQGEQIIAVPPRWYGLKSQLVLANTKTQTLGIYPVRIGFDLLVSCVDTLSWEDLWDVSGTNEIILNIIRSQGLYPLTFAKKFVLGDPKPLLVALGKQNRLIPALITLMSDGTNTDETIDRVTVIKTIDDLTNHSS